VSEVFAVHNPDLAVIDVVFIHGLNGDARETWLGKDQVSFWPQWLAEDIDGVAVWSVGYEAAATGWRGHSMSIADRAINVMALLQSHGIGDRPLCFVTHSMGGLLAKKILLHAAERRTPFTAFATAIRGVVFLATPHTGSGLTKAVKALGFLYQGTPAVEDLSRNDPDLRELNDRYRDWVDETGIQHLVFFESRQTKGVRVVDETSANPGLVRVQPIPVDANHIDICKPPNRSALVYGQVKLFVGELITQLQAGEEADAGLQDIEDDGRTLKEYSDGLIVSLSLGWQLGRYEFIQGSELPEAQAVEADLRSEIEILSEECGIQVSLAELSSGQAIKQTLIRALVRDVRKHAAILVGMAACRAGLVGTSSDLVNNEKMRQLAFSALLDVDPSIVPNRRAFFDQLLQERPTTISALASMVRRQTGHAMP
jgi:pimeloyl-ACP methyl ester carboxylesterase